MDKIPAFSFCDFQVGKKGKRSITVDTALRLERYFPWPAEVWLNLQAHHDQQIAKEAMKAELAGIRPCPGVG